MKYIILIGLFSLTIKLCGQELNDSTSIGETILVADNAPEYPGGRNELYKFIGTHLKYPKDARRNRIEGRVVISFIIERDGSFKPENIKIEQSLYPSLDEEAIRVIKLMPNWIPASHQGQKVRAKTGLPITFALQ
jgi:periplasmic protein TonB